MTASVLSADGFGSSPMYYCLLLRASRGAVGFAFFYFAYSTWEGRVLYLEDLYIQESERGKGAGKAVMKTLARVAKGCGCKR